jgi:hypothetical protein
MSTISTYFHENIGAEISLTRSEPFAELSLSVINTKSSLQADGTPVPVGAFYNFLLKRFDSTTFNPTVHKGSFYAVTSVPQLSTISFSAPKYLKEAIFRVDTTANTVTPTYEYEKHLWGKESPSSGTLKTCVIFGSLLDVAGQPMENQKIEAYINRNGFYTFEEGTVGGARTAVTDENGYFELPLTQGMYITLVIPAIGYRFTGYVPPVDRRELDNATLLTYKPK